MAMPLPDEHQLEELKKPRIARQGLVVAAPMAGTQHRRLLLSIGHAADPLALLPKAAGEPDSGRGVAMLARALLTHPEVHYLPRFPTPAEMLLAYRRALAQSNRTLADPDTALGLLLAGSHQRQALAQRHRSAPSPRRSAGCWGRCTSCCCIMGCRVSRRWSTGRPSRPPPRASICTPAMTTWARRAPYRPRQSRKSRPETEAEPDTEHEADSDPTDWLKPRPARRIGRASVVHRRRYLRQSARHLLSGGRTAADVA